MILKTYLIFLMILTIFVADDQAQYRQSYCHQFETKKNLNGLTNTLLIHSIVWRLIKCKGNFRYRH